MSSLFAEIDAMGRKAARGAGYDWGMAEEAGRAARWLASFRLPGPEALLAVLERFDGVSAAHRPRPDMPRWASTRGPLCPVATGAALSDRAVDIAGGMPIALGPVATPLLLVPFLNLASRDLGHTIAIEGSGLWMCATPDGPFCRDWKGFLIPEAAELRIFTLERPIGNPEHASFRPWSVEAGTWRGLNRFAHLTYVPATEASRAGAGAGSRDSD